MRRGFGKLTKCYNKRERRKKLKSEFNQTLEELLGLPIFSQ